MKKSELRQMIREEISRLNEAPDPSSFKMGKPLDPAYMRKGDTVYVGYKSVKPWLSEFLGFSDHKVKYGEGGPKFSTIQNALRAYKAKSLADLEKATDEFPYGHGVYMLFKSLEDGDEYTAYLHKGKWSIGSSADPMKVFQAKEG